MEKRIKILIPGWSVGDNSFGVGKKYIEYFAQYGDVIMAAPTTTIYRDIDLVVLPGGADVMSSRYGQIPSVLNTHPDLFKEFFLDNNLKGYIENGAAVYGICLGMQMLQVYAGGPLVQHCSHPYSNPNYREELIHEAVFTKPFDYIREELGIPKTKRTTKGDERPGFMVNSLHHQGVDIDELAEGFQPVLLGPHNIVEAMIHEYLPIAGYQGHPEESYCEVSDYLIRMLIKKIQNKEKLNTKGLHTHEKDLLKD